MPLVDAITFRCVLLGLIVLLGVAPAYSMEWKLLDRNSQGDTLWIDPAAIEWSGSTVRFTERILFVRPRSIAGGHQLFEMRTRYAMSCADRMNAALETHHLTAAGDVVLLDPKDKANPKWLPVSTDPKSPDGILFAHFCSPSKR